MTRTLAAQRLERIIAGAMSFIFEVIDLSKLEIFFLMKRIVRNQWWCGDLAKLSFLIEIRGYRSLL